MRKIILIIPIVGLLFVNFGSVTTRAKSDLTCLCFKGDSNCYLYGQNGTAIVVDAGANAGSVQYYATQDGLKIKYIILTHGHWDHISHLEELKAKTGASVIIHKNDINLLQKDHPRFKPDGVVNGGEIIKAGSLNLEIIHTPGHTPGSICIREGNAVFTGDTLFKQSVGRTDFEGGNAGDLAKSLQKLMQLDDQITVCPGHEEATTIGDERKSNPFLQ